MTRLLLASVHHAILVFSCASLLLFGSLSIGDTIGKSSDRDGHENQTAVTAPAEHRGSTKGILHSWCLTSFRRKKKRVIHLKIGILDSGSQILAVGISQNQSNRQIGITPNGLRR
jgi:hypothetical protein